MRSSHVIKGLPSDLIDGDTEYSRYIKTLPGDLSYSVGKGLAYSLYLAEPLPAGEWISLNIQFASDVIVHGVNVPPGVRTDIRNSAATGTSGSLIAAKNLNLCSDDVTPASAQVFTDSAPAPDVLCFDTGSMKPLVRSCYGKEFSVNSYNPGTSEISDFEMIVIFEEYSERAALFGLTPSTQLEPNTEMAQYNG